MVILRSRRITIVAAAVVAIMVAAVALLRSFVFELLIVNGHSMNPTIRHRDRILVSRLAYRFGKPRTGDVIAFKVEGGRILVKRVVGMPGDLIEVRDGLLYRNGEAVLHEPYVNSYSHNSRWRSYRPRMVQVGHLFVMGDNRTLSLDSKDFGPIPYRNIIGKVIFICFPPKRVVKLSSVTK